MATVFTWIPKMFFETTGREKQNVRTFYKKPKPEIKFPTYFRLNSAGDPTCPTGSLVTRSPLEALKA